MREIDAGLRAHATPERAEGEKRYLKSELEHYGVTMPVIRRITLDVVREVDLSHDELLAVVEQLWSKPVHERRVAAAELLEAKPQLLGSADLPVLERLIRESRTWALVDPLAASVVGRVALTDLAVAPVLDRWSRDEDFWVRRAALLALLAGVRTGRPDLARVARYSDEMLDEREFFIRKAIGWLLREVARHDPAWVVTFLEPRASRAAGLTIREALKHADAPTRDRLLAAHRRGAT